MTITQVLVAVPARDEEDLLGPCLTAVERAVACLRRAHPTMGHLVVVTLDGCTDASAAVAARHAVTPVLGPGSGVGAARDAGIETGLAMTVAEGTDLSRTWIACTDADSLVPPHWLTAQVALADTGLDLVVGTVEPDATTAPAVLRTWQERHTLAEDHRQVHGANLGIRACAYVGLGGFASLSTHEDVDLVARARAAGHPWVATDTTRVHTSAREQSRVDGGFATYLSALRDARMRHSGLPGTVRSE